MPLADLRMDGASYATSFSEVTSVPSAELKLGSRIATLSTQGILILQQRLIKHYTRLTVDLPTLRNQSAPVLAEAELQQDWVERALRETERSDEELSKSSADFQSWLDEGAPSNRDLLKSEVHHADLRRRLRAAVSAHRAGGAV